MNTSLFSSTADIRFKYKPMVTSVNEVPVDWGNTNKKKYQNLSKNSSFLFIYSENIVELKGKIRNGVCDGGSRMNVLNWVNYQNEFN